MEKPNKVEDVPKESRGKFQAEQSRTAEWLADVIQFLRHDTSSTRLQLVEVLRGRADLIESEAKTDHAMNRILSGDRRPTTQANSSVVGGNGLARVGETHEGEEGGGVLL